MELEPEPESSASPICIMSLLRYCCTYCQAEDRRSGGQKESGPECTSPHRVCSQASSRSLSRMWHGTRGGWSSCPCHPHLYASVTSRCAFLQVLGGDKFALPMEYGWRQLHGIRSTRSGLVGRANTPMRLHKEDRAGFSERRSLDLQQVCEPRTHLLK